MENEDQNARIRRNYVNTFHRKIKENPEVFDFYSNIISSLLTLLALLATIYFSLSALNKTDIQNKNAEEQLKQAKAQLFLAENQFKESKILHTEDSLASTVKDSILNIRFTLDTTKQRMREMAQERRNQFQDSSNRQQFALSSAQLKAVQIQAKTAQAQFTQQQIQYKQQLYEQRPVFFIDSININKVNSVKSIIKFFISNKGVRIAHVDSTVLAFYNPQMLCFSVTANGSNFDLIPQKNSIFTSPINIYEDCLTSTMTIYYLLIYYKDAITGLSQIEPIFFRYEITKQHQFTWFHVSGPILKEFISKLKTKKVLIFEQ